MDAVSARDRSRISSVRSTSTTAWPFLAQVHARLADLVAPARPRTILLLAEEKEKANPFYFLGEVPLIRRLMFISIISLIGLISVSLSSAVDGNPKSFSLLENQGTSLLLNQLFLLTAASLGASFANLIQTQRYIKDGTFDPKYESSYWVDLGHDEVELQLPRPRLGLEDELTRRPRDLHPALHPQDGLHEGELKRDDERDGLDVAVLGAAAQHVEPLPPRRQLPAKPQRRLLPRHDTDPP